MFGQKINKNERNNLGEVLSLLTKIATCILGSLVCVSIKIELLHHDYLIWIYSSQKRKAAFKKVENNNGFWSQHTIYQCVPVHRTYSSESQSLCTFEILNWIWLLKNHMLNCQLFMSIFY